MRICYDKYMRIEIDQSIKIENTNKSTVLAFSNNKNGALIISAREKKLIQKFFRQIGKPRLFAHLTFAAGVYLLIKNMIKNRDQLVIDREYPGYEKFISAKIKEFVSENSKVKEIHISIGQIGKKSRAHIIAYSLKDDRNRRDLRKIFTRELIRIIKRNLKSGST